MLIQQAHEVEEAINNGDIESIRNDLDFRVLTSIIESNRFDLVEIIYNHFKDTEPMEQLIFNAVVESAGVDITPTAIQCLNFLKSLDKEISYEFDDEDALYHMCQIPGRVELFKLMLDMKADIPWGYVLQVSCNFICRDTIEFLIANIQVSNEELNLAFGYLVNASVTSCYHENSDQTEIISWFINKLNVDVNLTTDSDYAWAYLDCFINAPNAAKHFYVERFNSGIINSEDFWAKFIEAYLEDQKFKQAFAQAFEDLRNSSIDLTELATLFDRLGHDALAKELLN
ncbi:hypothetical protein I6M59_07980 [Shewanella algae]|uniref:hypothetical protein n=1 Tax=Shewanella algae TaxID=38313 RepID=UPI00118423B4|nr:hypothetical protein [Shewanella algae]MBO2691688.1 hypothetical protein [Shewanella algae]MDV2960983.1 hypothetical protein [Shewanella algae]TVK95846.1 hypothetical protein AYJ01_03705 [Shewanella algae]